METLLRSPHLIHNGGTPALDLRFSVLRGGSAAVIAFCRSAHSQQCIPYRRRKNWRFSKSLWRRFKTLLPWTQT
ncbi:hypothetical protein PAMP_002643 [Pampus punctatissimus]